MARRPSSIDRLAPELQRLIADLRIEHGWNIDDILEKLRELGAMVSRTALARKTKTLDEISRDLHRTRETARILTEAIEPGEDGKVTQLGIELLESALVRLMTASAEDGQMVTFDPKEAMQLSITLKNLVGSKGGLNDIRVKAKAEQKKESAETAKGAAQAAGLSKATVDAIYHAVLGVAA